MTTRETQNELTSPLLDDNLFLPVSDTNFRDLVAETFKLIQFSPEILSSIEADQDAPALKKKELRLADQQFFAEQTAPLPGVCPDPDPAVGLFIHSAKSSDAGMSRTNKKGTDKRWNCDKGFKNEIHPVKKASTRALGKYQRLIAPPGGYRAAPRPSKRISGLASASIFNRFSQPPPSQRK